MDLENTKAQMRKGILEYCILSVFSRNSCYASDIIKELKEAEVIVVEGTLYPLLTRQKNAGLLSYRWEESQQGPPRNTMNSPRQAAPTLPILINRGRNLSNQSI